MKKTEKQALGTPHAFGSEAAPWLRARRPEHKQERRDAILSGAVRLLDDVGVEGTTLSAIAREAGLSKANCYRYFESREAILLAVILDEAQAWTHKIDGRLKALSRPNDADAVADILVRATVERPRLCMLISSLWSVLERNVGVDSIADFKRSFIQEMSVLIDSVHSALPLLSADNSYTFVSFFFFFVAGSWSAANPAPIVVEVLDRKEFKGQCIDFEAVLSAHAKTMLRGLLAGK